MRKVAAVKNKIEFNRKIYHRSAIDRAARAFKKLAYFQIEENKDKIIVLIKEAAGAEQESVVDEFANYALAETIAGRQY